MRAADRSPEIIGITVLTLTLSYIAVVARIITRTLIRPNFGLDDIFIIITLCIFTGYCIAEFVGASHGVGKDVTTLSPADANTAGRSSVVGEALAVWSYPTGKAAVAYLLMRIFPSRTLAWVLWLSVALNAVVFYISGVIILAQCSPFAYSWDKTIPGGKCWNPAILGDWGYLTGGIGAATDFAYAIIPWFYIARLQMSKRKKIVVGLALSTGLVPFVCSILKMYYLSALSAVVNPNYATIDLVYAGEAELCAINIAACIPTLGPLYKWFKEKRYRSFSKSPTHRQSSEDMNGMVLLERPKAATPC